LSHAKDGWTNNPADDHILKSNSHDLYNVRSAVLKTAMPNIDATAVYLLIHSVNVHAIRSSVTSKSDSGQALMERRLGPFSKI
jgi:hypothetical protein